MDVGLEGGGEPRVIAAKAHRSAAVGCWKFGFTELEGRIQDVYFLLGRRRCVPPLRTLLPYREGGRLE